MLEETPAPNLPAGMADALCAAAVALGKAVSYRSAGTVEFVYDSAARASIFSRSIPVCRLSTASPSRYGASTGTLDGGAGGRGFTAAHCAAGRPDTTGHAIQARIYAEDPGRQFQPSPVC